LKLTAEWLDARWHVALAKSAPRAAKVKERAW
jgi:hypothetical protein